MIIEIPTPDEFQATGLSQLHLAWGVAMQAVETFEEASDYLDEDEQTEAFAEYWRKSQPALANAYSLVQQAMEMALKGRIAAVSPYLLIARDPRDWPKGSDLDQVPFSEFRTLDAADLVKVHNTFSPTALDAEFRNFWEEVRRDRNKVMHSVAAKTFDPATLIRTVLVAAAWLFGGRSWPRRLIDMEENGTHAALGAAEFTYNTVLRQLDFAMRHLAPAEKRALLGYRTNQRSYLCPACYNNANHDVQDEWPHLAQLKSRRAGEPLLRCIVCETESKVDRQRCVIHDCLGDVIFDEMCLTCHREQDDPSEFDCGLADPSLERDCRYILSFRRGSESRGDWRSFVDDEGAKEHSRLALLAPHLAKWQSVVVKRHSHSLAYLGGNREDTVIGAWIRNGDQLQWKTGREVGDESLF